MAAFRITAAVRAADITKRTTAHTLRAAFAYRLKEADYQLMEVNFSPAR